MEDSSGIASIERTGRRDDGAVLRRRCRGAYLPAAGTTAGCGSLVCARDDGEVQIPRLRSG